MNYSKIYYNIIERSKSRTIPPIAELHHIVPKSLGGSNKKENLASLTPREHFVCHLLLTKMYSGKEKQKMVYALWAIINLCNRHQYRKTVKA
jgi:5-methylcytosine-specific restriction endonuclease McrA